MRVIGLTVAVIGWLYIFGGHSGARQFVAASVVDRLVFVPLVLIPLAIGRRVGSPTLSPNVRAIGVSVAEGASARATTWKKACDGIASPTTSICTMRGACRRAGKPYRDTRSQSLCDPEPIYWPGLYLPSVKCPLMTQSGHCAAEEGARRHRCRSLGPSVAVHSRQIVIAIHYAKPSTIGKIEVIHGFARPARSRTFPEGF